MNKTSCSSSVVFGLCAKNLSNCTKNSKNTKPKVTAKPKKQKNSNSLMTGSGAYSLDSIKKALKPVIKDVIAQGSDLAGNLVTKHTGSDRAGALVKKLGAKFAKLMGSGDYQVCDMCETNSLFGKGKVGMSNASFYNTEMGTRVVHREYLGDVFTGSSAGVFNNTSFPINPGLSYVFPYLSQIAANFEEYSFKGLVFEFISTTSPYNSNSAMGSAVMSMEYNASAPPFTSKPQMENSDFAISSRFDKSMLYGVECKENALNSYYVRSSASTIPLTNTDLGNFQFATVPASTFPTSSTIGELWVSYDVELLRPRISPERYGYAHFRGTAVCSQTQITQYTPSSVPTIYGALSGATLSFSSSTGIITVSFPNADIGDTYSCLYMLTWNSSGVTTVSANPASTGSSGVTDLLLLNGNSSYSAYGTGFPSSGGACYTYNGFWEVNSELGNVSISFNGPNFSTAVTPTLTLDLIFTDLGNGFTNSTL